jgi:hypothetical protein
MATPARPRWTHPTGPLEDIQYWADRIQTCLELLEQSTENTDDLVDLQRVRILIDALEVQQEQLVETIDEHAGSLVERPCNGKAGA